MNFYEPFKAGFIVRIKLTPNASACGFGDLFQNADEQVYLKAGITTAPEKGKANKDLIKMLAKELQIAKQNIELISGATTHLKKLYINQQLTPELTQKLNGLIKGN